MKASQIFITLSILLMSTVGFAQTNAAKKETIKVWGECGMCKKTIETAAKKAGATTATWDVDAKMLTVAYQPSKTSNQKIQQSIAAAGYDTKDFTANDAAYNGLHACCKYDRKEKNDAAVVADSIQAGHH
jgi:periplasmic mercuric ion binding protein